MKANHTLLFLFSMIIFIGQDLLAQNLEIGITGGAGFSKTYPQPTMVDRRKAKFSYSAGFNFKYVIGNFTAGMNILYEKKGDAMKENVYSGPPYTIVSSADLHMNYNYLTIPILIGYRPKQLSNFGFDVGPYYSYLLNMEYVTYYDDRTVRNTAVSSNIQDYDFGLVTAVYYSFRMNDHLNLSLQARANIGLSELEIHDMVDVDLRHRSLMFMVGLDYLIN